MSRTLSLWAVALCTAVLLLITLPECQGGDPPSAEVKIEQALENATQMEFIETPLADVVDYLKDLHEIEIQFDTRALDDFVIGKDEPVTVNLKGVSLRSALNLTLRRLRLTYVIQDEVLLLTTSDAAQNMLTTKVYLVEDLRNDGETLIGVITTTVEADSWNEADGPGAIVGGSLGGVQMLVISQTYDIHRKIARLLAELRKVAGIKQQAAEPAPQPVATGGMGRGGGMGMF